MRSVLAACKVADSEINSRQIKDLEKRKGKVCLYKIKSLIYYTREE